MLFLAAYHLFFFVPVTDVIADELENPISIPLSVTPKIIGGTTAPSGSWPWMAALIRSGSTEYFYGQFCGGALITETWVLTAAHCVYDNYLNTWDNPGDLDVVMGIHNLKTDTGDRISVRRIVGHPDYNPVTFDSDLALLELERSSTAQTLPLFSDVTNNLSGEMATIIGWGDTEKSGSSTYPADLQQVSIPVIEDSTCNTVYPGQISENMLCAGFVDGGKDACFGDSGGPLMVQVDNQWQHAGIISWGNGCALPDSYGVNTRTSRFYDFISTYIAPQPKISVNPQIVQFGYVPLDVTREHTVLVKNLGQEDLIIGIVGQQDPLELPFVKLADTCSGATLASAEQCNIVVSYTPEVLKDYQVSFDIQSNDPNVNPSTVYITASKQFPWHFFVPAITGGQNPPLGDYPNKVTFPTDN